MKRKEHKIDKTDIELNEWEYRLVMGDAWEHRDIYINNFFCTCKVADRKLVDVKVYLTNLNDLVLNGTCSGCNTITTRYIETGENPESAEAAERIRKMKNSRR